MNRKFIGGLFIVFMILLFVSSKAVLLEIRSSKAVIENPSGQHIDEKTGSPDDDFVDNGGDGFSTSVGRGIINGPLLAGLNEKHGNTTIFA